MPAIRRVVYNGPLDAVDVPSVFLFGLRRGEPVEVGESAAEAVLAHPEFADADAPAEAAPPVPVVGDVPEPSPEVPADVPSTDTAQEA